MKNLKISLIATVILAVPTLVSAQFEVVNNGVLATINEGCIVSIKTGDFLNTSGTISNSGRITVEGDLVNDDQIDGGGASTGIFNVEDNWENNGSFNADQSTVNLIGGSQGITGTSVTSFYNLSLLGPGVKTMSIDAEVQNILDLVDQELNTDVNQLFLSSPSSTALAFDNGFVSSVGNGRLAWNTNSMNDYLFQVGSSVGTQRIRPVRITPTSTDLNTYEVRLANVDATTEGYNLAMIDGEICDVNELFYHLIERSNGSTSADIALHFISAQDGAWDRGLHWQNLPQWENMLGATTGVNGLYNTMEIVGWNDFSLPAYALGYTLPAVSLSTSGEATCIAGSIIDLTGSPSGGVYSGIGVTGTQFNPANAGIGFHDVTYSYIDGNGCEAEETETIEVYSQPAVALTTPTDLEICDGEELEISATPGFATYEWSNSENTSTILVTEEGAYNVIVTDTNGCEGMSATANVTVHPVPTPVVTANGPLEICEGESLTLSAGQGFGSYSWSTLATTNSISVSQTGTYNVTVTNQFLCSGTSDDVDVTVLEVTPGIISSAGDMLSVDPPGLDYQWFLNGSPIPGATQDTFIALSSGNYTVEYTADNGCPTDSYILEFTLTIGVEETALFNHLDIYPNPGKGQFVIDASLHANMDVLISFTDMVGRKVADDVSLGNVDGFRSEVDMSEYANGVYFINILVDDQKTTVRYIKS